jgi:hypothetical protein
MFFRARTVGRLSVVLKYCICVLLIKLELNHEFLSRRLSGGFPAGFRLVFPALCPWFSGAFFRRAVTLEARPCKHRRVGLEHGYPTAPMRVTRGAGARRASPATPPRLQSCSFCHFRQIPGYGFWAREIPGDMRGRLGCLQVDLQVLATDLTQPVFLTS